MAYGTPVKVRSHRAGRRRRRSRFSRGMRVTLVVVLLLAGAVVGYQQLLARTCSGQATLRLTAPSATAGLLTTLAAEWSSREPSTAGGTCAQVVVTTRGSAETAVRLASGWAPGQGDEPPHVWVPESRVWSQRAGVTARGAAVVPSEAPSVARSPLVLAVPQPASAALDWPDVRFDGQAPRWRELPGQLPGDWQELGQPWGEFRFGMTDPARDTAGLLTLTAVLDDDTDGRIGDDELAGVDELYAAVTSAAYHQRVRSMFNQLDTVADQAADVGGAGQAEFSEGVDPAGEAVLGHVSTFPVLESELIGYNRSGPQVPLAAVYPADGAVQADHPYLVLRGDWVGDREREVAGMFLTFLRSPSAGRELRQAGLRDLAGALQVDGDGVAGEQLLVPAPVPSPPVVPEPASVALAADRWTAVSRPTNALLAVDVSGSMDQPLADGERRLDRVRQAAAATVEVFGADDQVGLWEFATELDGDLAHRSLVPLGRVGSSLADGRERRDHLLAALDELSPGGGSGLYRTIQAGYDAVLANYDPAAANLVVVVTDGPDDPARDGSLSLDGLLDHVRVAGDGERVRVVVVAFGPEPDVAALDRVARATGGAVYHSADGSDLPAVLRTAVFSARAADTGSDSDD